MPHRIALFAILLLLGGEVFLSNRQQSQTWDESAHLYSGYEYWTRADFGRNPEHPPLAKLVAASAVLPLHPADPAGPSNSLSKSLDYVNGGRFLYVPGAGADMLLARARGAMCGVGGKVTVAFGRPIVGDSQGCGRMPFTAVGGNSTVEGVMVKASGTSWIVKWK
jgi:hypothetical protein